MGGKGSRARVKAEVRCVSIDVIPIGTKKFCFWSHCLLKHASQSSFPKLHYERQCGKTHDHIRRVRGNIRPASNVC